MNTPGNGTLMRGTLLRFAFTALALSALIAASSNPSTFAASSDQEEARVTLVTNEVNLLPEDGEPRPAEVDDMVAEDTAVRTGNEARSELTFADLTITRLGANTIYNFNKAGRRVELSEGQILLRVPKNSGGAKMRTEACTVGISGTTVILEATRSGRNTLAVLEGGARMSLNQYPGESAFVRAGQILQVPPGAKKMPAPKKMDIDKLMDEHPLVTDFPPLPNEDEIYAGPSNPSGSGPRPAPLPRRHTVTRRPGGGAPPSGGGRNYPRYPLPPSGGGPGHGVNVGNSSVNVPVGGQTPKGKKPKKPRYPKTPKTPDANPAGTPYKAWPKHGGKGKKGGGRQGRGKGTPSPTPQRNP